MDVPVHRAGMFVGLILLLKKWGRKKERREKIRKRGKKEGKKDEKYFCF